MLFNKVIIDGKKGKTTCLCLVGLRAAVYPALSGFIHAVVIASGPLVSLSLLLLSSVCVCELQRRADHAWTSAGRRVPQFRGRHHHRQDQVPRFPGQLVSAQALRTDRRTL